MPGKLLRPALLLLSGLLLFTQCNVIRDLMTEPKSGPVVTRPAPPPGPGRVPDREMRLRQDIVEYGKKYLGTKYKYAGTSPKKGFDCSGFTSYVMDRFNISLSRSSRAQENQGREIKISEANTGDLIFYRRSKKGAVFHVSLVVSNDRNGLRVIHSVNRGVVIDNVSESSYWKRYISTARDVISR